MGMIVLMLFNSVHQYVGQMRIQPSPRMQGHQLHSQADPQNRNLGTFCQSVQQSHFKVLPANFNAANFGMCRDLKIF